MKTTSTHLTPWQPIAGLPRAVPFFTRFLARYEIKDD